MSPVELGTFILCLVTHVVTAEEVDSACKYYGDYHKSIPETASSKDGVLQTIVGLNAIVSFDAYARYKGNYMSFSYYFTLTKERGYEGRDNFQFSLSKEINLDWVRTFPRLPNGGIPITVRITCIDKKHLDSPNTYFFYITVLPVNNHPPAIQPNALITVKEDQPLYTNFAHLNTFVVDEDYPDQTALTQIVMIRNPKDELDGGIPPFLISSTGYIAPSSPLDYDFGKKIYKLQIKVTNNVSQTADGIITIQVLNVNDNPVRFVYKNCMTKCVYELSNVKDAQNDEILATDADNDTIEYSIINASPALEIGIMSINNKTGKLRQIKYANDTELDLLTLTIKAQAKSSLPTARNITQLSLNEDYATVKVHFQEIRLSVNGGHRVLVDNIYFLACYIIIIIIQHIPGRTLLS